MKPVAESTIGGGVLYRARVALPSGSVVRVWLEDASREDAAPVVVDESEIITSGEQVPIPFALAIDASTLDARGRYVLRAAIEIDGAMCFTSTTAHPLPSDIPPAGIELIVQPVTPLERSEWTLVELDGAAVALGEGENAPFLMLDPEGTRLSGSGGCNRLVGTFDRKGDALRFTDIGATRMACLEPVMERESAFLAALAATTRFELDGPSLVLLDGDRTLARLDAASH